MKTLFFSLLLVSYAMAENQLIGVPVVAKKLELLPEPTSEVAITPVTPVTPTTTTAVLLSPPAPPTMVAENNITPTPTPAPPTMAAPTMQPPATPAQPLPTIQAIQKTNLMPAQQLAPTAPPQPTAVTKPQYKVCQGDLPYSPEVAVVLSNDKFFPSRVKLFEGQPARLIFATTNRKPAALIIERLKFQRWIAKEPKLSSPESGKFELNRELVTNRVTEVTFEPKRGSYTFHDAVSGASGEILVE
jgi:hypothetical protein